MSREIKFKAWDKATRKVLEVINIDFSSMELLVIDHEEQEAREAVHGYYELMEYTGFKDSNGTEIYEGYVVKYEGYFGHNLFQVTKARSGEWRISNGRGGKVLVFCPRYRNHRSSWEYL